MIKAEKMIDELMNTIKSDNRFKDVKIIKAYPNYDKPTRLSRAHIAIGIMKMNFEPYQIDDSEKAGELTIFADLFCPLKWDNSELTKLFSGLCNTIAKYNITSIQAEKITADANTQAYQLKTTITFYNAFDFGGDA